MAPAKHSIDGFVTAIVKAEDTVENLGWNNIDDGFFAFLILVSAREHPGMEGCPITRLWSS